MVNYFNFNSDLNSSPIYFQNPEFSTSAVTVPLFSNCQLPLSSQINTKKNKRVIRKITKIAEKSIDQQIQFCLETKDYFKVASLLAKELKSGNAIAAKEIFFNLLIEEDFEIILENFLAQALSDSLLVNFYRKWVPELVKDDRELVYDLTLSLFKNDLAQIECYFKKYTSIFKSLKFHALKESFLLEEKSMVVLNKSLTKEDKLLFISIYEDDEECRDLIHFFFENTTCLYSEFRMKKDIDFQCAYTNAKINYNFFLDKANFNHLEEYEDGELWLLEYSMPIFCHALQQITQNFELTNHQIDYNLFIKMAKSLDQALYTVKETERNNENTIYSKIEDLKAGDLFLYPIETAGHATLLCLKKESQDKATVYLYNTGLSSDRWHFKLEGSSYYQTFYQLNQISIDSLNPTFWADLKNLTESHQCYHSFDPVYTFLNDKLNQGKQISYKAENPLLYEPVQQKGTCTAQCLYAFFRHQILTQPSSSIEKNYQDYKISKGYLQKAIFALEQKEEIIDLEQEKIRDLALSKIEKTHQNLEIFSLMTHHFKQTKASIAETLEVLNKKSMPFLSIQNSSPSTFIILKDLYKEIAKTCREQQKALSLMHSSPSLKPALVLFQNYN
ncbi:Conserved hypothetical protein [Candidatus Protochlamydia naegleriophila]|uniref:Uncharacterized protein n=1 Tax=Candidatus Protochlamydia naegleriophila TaxID=389348 RepID=A0A0U5J9H0_9BACT|nr:hypothetical protein [Candidatus Protochlamydia naegleriophila]CUI15725.1 Conserved hypothetical protein [Candidatus Protochlamydia naegleriophila]